MKLRYCFCAVMKSGYPDYLKFGFTRNSLVTKNLCPKSGNPNKLFLEHYFVIFMFSHTLFLRSDFFLQKNLDIDSR